EADALAALEVERPALRARIRHRLDEGARAARVHGHLARIGDPWQRGLGHVMPAPLRIDADEQRLEARAIEGADDEAGGADGDLVLGRATAEEDEHAGSWRHRCDRV